MQFSEYIKKLPSAWVFEHFIKGSDISRKILSSSMIDQAAEQFIRPENIKKQFESLDSGNRKFCALVYLCGKDGLEIPHFRGFEDQRLLSFLMYVGRNSDGKVRAFGFDEFAPVLRDLCLEEISSENILRGMPPASPVWKWRCINDITITVSLGAQKQLKKKKNGGLTRTASLLLRKLTDIGVPHKNDSGEFVIQLLVRYCLSRHLLFETESEYLVNAAEFLSWMSVPVQKRFDDLVRYTITLSGGWDRSYLEGLLKSDVWVPTSIFPAEQRVSAENILQALRFIGLLELHKKNSEIYFSSVSHISEAAQSGLHKVMVLPDFSVVIPQEADCEEIYRFSQLGSFLTFDRVYKGKIEKNILSDAISRGIEGNQILEWLDTWQSPGNVKESVREWLREFYRLYVMERSLLISSDERVSFQINSYQPLRSLIEPVQADAIFKIKKGSEAKVKELLANMGFDYRMPGQDLESEAPHFTAADDLFKPELSFVPLTEPIAAESEPAVAMRGTKYGGELKELDMSEIVHVIDYATLTAQNLIIDYEGSPYVKTGVYIIKPLSCQKGIDPVLEAEVTRSHSRKQFYIKKIRKIGVQQQ